MPIEFRCDQCQRLLRVPDENAGAKARCPQCGSVQQIPSAPPPTPQQPVPGGSPFTQPSSGNPYAQAGTGAPPSGGSGPPTQPSGESGHPGQTTPNPFADPPAANPFADNPYQSPYATGYQSAAQFSEHSARSKVMGPGIALIIFGALGILLCGFAMLGGVISIAEKGMNEEDLTLLIGCGMSMLMAILTTVGGARMIVLRNYGLAMTATILSFVCGLCSWISIPFSIWALVVLCDSNVKAHFK